MRRCCLAFIGVSLAGLTGCGDGGAGPAIAPAERPNVVLIIVDTLRADKLSSYGHIPETSPELDVIARQGVQFMNVIAPSSWTRPSTGSMITGLHPRTLGLYKEQGEILNERFVTLAEALADVGYRTFGITANPVLNKAFNMDQGFDTYVDSGIVFSWMEPDAGQITAKGRPLPTGREVFEAVLEAEALRSVGPHFVQINIMDVHEYRRKQHHLTRSEFSGLFREEVEGDYLRAVRQASMDIDAFIGELSKRAGWENTLFIVTSDHGQGLHDHPDVPGNADSHGRVLYESQVVVPLILYHPGHLKGAKIDARVRLLDLMPTILEYTSVTFDHEIDGRSLLPLLRGKRVDIPEYFVTETQFRKVDKIGVYSKEWKYFHNRDGNRGLNEHELQKVGLKENGMKTDRIADYPEVAKRLRRHLEKWERNHPKTPPTDLEAGLSAEEEAQLKAIGYLE